MNVFACYVITVDGRLLVSQYFQDESKIPNEISLSGVLATIQMLSTDLVKKAGAAEKFTLDGLTYHFRGFEKFFVVLVSDLDGRPKKVLDQLGWKFMELFDYEAWDGRIDDFEPFREDINQIISTNFNIDIEGRIDPTKKLSPVTIFEFEEDLQEVAMELLRLEKVTIQELIDELDKSHEFVVRQLEILMEEGYIGTTKEGDKTYYFIIKQL